MKAKAARRSLVGRALAWLLALAALGFVAWHLPLEERCQGPLRCEPGLLPTLAHVRAGALGGLFALYMLGTLAWAARWRALLGFAGITWSLPRVWRIAIEAQAGGILLPGGVGGDAFRVGAVLAQPTSTGMRPQLSIALTSVLLDRVVGLSLIALLAGLLGLVFGSPPAARASGSPAAAILIAVLLAIPCGAALGLLLLRNIPRGWVAAIFGGRLETVLGPVLDYVRHPRALRAVGTAALLSAVVAITQMIVVRGILFALGATPTAETWVYVGTAMAFIAAAIPALPGGWGTADAAYVFFFGFAGIGSGAALAASLLYRVFWYATGALGAVLHVMRRGTVSPDRRAPQSQPTPMT